MVFLGGYPVTHLVWGKGGVLSATRVQGFDQMIMILDHDDVK